MTSTFAADPILVEVVRGGLVESAHHGRVVVTDPDGSVAFALGDSDAPFYPRSASKPLQAVAMLQCGLDLADDLLALVCASHSGEPMHIQGVRRILDTAKLAESALQTPADWPLDERAKEDAVRRGAGKTPLAMNCSGKHAGMLVTSVVNGWPTDTYRDPAHPLQQEVVKTLGRLSGDVPSHQAIDGCGAPLWALTLSGVARAFGTIAASSTGAEARVANAIRRHPELVSGSTRDELALHRAVPGLVGKAGAEAVMGVGLPDGRGVAVKISDGAPRARVAAVAGVLSALGFEHPTLVELGRVAVLGHGERVGKVRFAPEVIQLVSQHSLIALG